jgi:hypothetical protein
MPPPRNLPANIWEKIIANGGMNKGDMARLRLVSSEARRGSANAVKKHTTLQRAFTSANATAIRPLLAALKKPTQGVRNTTVKLGKHKLFVSVYPGGQAKVNLDRPAMRTRFGNTVPPARERVASYIFDRFVYAPSGISMLGPGGHNLVRRVKAAFQKIYGTS